MPRGDCPRPSIQTNAGGSRSGARDAWAEECRLEPHGHGGRRVGAGHGDSRPDARRAMMGVVSTAPTLRKALKAKSPGLAVERSFWEQGHEVVVGVDEVGRGSWAGPLTIGAAVLPQDRRVYKVRDS